MLLQSDNSIIYGLDHQARSLCSIAAEQDTAQFLIGTQTLKFENQICLVEVDEDTNQVIKSVYKHPNGEIWHLAASFSDPQLVASCYSKVNGSKVVSGCSLWRMSQPNANNPEQNNLEEVSTFPNENSTAISSFSWRPDSTDKCSKAAVVYDQKLAIVNVDTNESKMQVESQCEISCKSSVSHMLGKWNPHHNSNIIALACDSSIKSIDMRTMKESFLIDNCHFGIVRDLDFNPNKQYYLASAGDDSKVKIWDYRSLAKPVQSVAVHSHWVWCVRFNPIHDQLLLSCSSDTKVVLYSAASVSSEPGGGDDDNDTVLKDGVVRAYDEHEESVYCCDWSIADPWIFASLSYDGRLIINHVPNNTKYEILQL